jgi:hypothetical protein
MFGAREKAHHGIGSLRSALLTDVEDMEMQEAPLRNVCYENV